MRITPQKTETTKEIRPTDSSLDSPIIDNRLEPTSLPSELAGTNENKNSSDTDKSAIPTTMPQADVPVTTLSPSQSGLALPEDWASVTAYPPECVDWIAYHSDQMSAINVYRLGKLADGRMGDPNISREPNTLNFSPSISADRQWVAFVSDRDGNFEIYMSAVNTNDIRRLTRSDSVEFNPVWSPHRYDILFESRQSGNPDLVLMNVTTGVTRQLTDHPAVDINPSWSPLNPNIVVFQSNRSGRWQLYRLELTTNLISLLSDGLANDTMPIFAQQSEQIVFLSDRDSAGLALYLLHEDGTQERISDTSKVVRNHVWSPDDTLIAYQSDQTDMAQVYVYEPSTKSTRRVTGNDETMDISPSFAPTFRCSSSAIVVYTTIVGDKSELFQSFTRPVDSPAIDVLRDATNLTNNPQANDGFPQGLTSTKSNFARLINSYVNWND